MNLAASGGSTRKRVFRGCVEINETNARFTIHLERGVPRLRLRSQEVRILPVPAEPIRNSLEDNDCPGGQGQKAEAVQSKTLVRLLPQPTRAHERQRMRGGLSGSIQQS